MKRIQKPFGGLWPMVDENWRLNWTPLDLKG